jgi:hypothetical protein
MTHIFECPTNEYCLIESGKKSFDILKFGPRVQIRDTIIYQRLNDMEDDPADPDCENDTPCTDDELSVTIDYILSGADSGLKQGYTAIGFKEKDRP